MLRLFRAYPVLLRAYWQLALEYRVQIVMWTLAGTYPLVMMAVWLNLARGGEINGFGPAQFVGYYLAVVWIRRITYIWVLDEIEERVRTGELSAYLLRPLGLAHMLFTQVVSVRFFNALLVGSVISAIILIIPGQQWVVTPANALAFCLVTPIGFLFEFFLQYIVGMLAFWTTQVYRIFDVFFFVKSLLGGFVVPLALMPPALQAIAKWLPFQSSIALPAEILIGQATPERVLSGALVSLAWVIGMASFSRWLWGRGLRSYSAVGA
ncbi:MAG: multidrug ABC transporter permease [Candidatus Roseilinea sp.]|nr:MAG: multidrug ABC transporter permease [Candidatus Roseilinea sp.]